MILLLRRLARIPIGVTVIVAMEETCLVFFWRYGKHLHLILFGDPVGFETNSPLEWAWSDPFKWSVLDMDLAPEVGANLFFIYLIGVILWYNRYMLIQWKPMNFNGVYKFMRKLHSITKHLLVELYEIYFLTILFTELGKYELDTSFALLYWWFSIRYGELRIKLNPCHTRNSRKLENYAITRYKKESN